MRSSSYPSSWRLFTLTGLMVLTAAAAPLQAQRPNILLVMTDDQGWGDVRSHGNPELDTPAMDALARAGVRFDRFYVSPVCSPTRASLLTGRYSLRTGVYGVTRGRETMRSEEVTLAETLRDAGYATGIFGKWHNGAHFPHDPAGQGFDTFFGFSAGHWNNYVDTDLIYNGETVPTRGFITDVLTDSALAFMRRHRERPFFAYVPFNAPHSPFQAPDALFRKYTERGFDNRDAAAYAMVENVDENLRRLLGELDRLGLRDRTIVLFLTDNGPNGVRWNGGMRGIKGSVREGGTRVPFFMHWPGQIEGGLTVQEKAAHIDVMPTLLELVGLQAPSSTVMDGRSLVPLLSGEGTDWPDRMLYIHHFGQGPLRPLPGSVRYGHWSAVNEGRGWELYDLWADPAERTDVAPEHPELSTSLAGAYEAWFADVTGSGLEQIPVPLGHAESPRIVLPGHEALLHGEGIRYVDPNGWANDWVTGWTNVEAFPAWPVEVVRAGRYEISLDYAVAPEDAGSRIRVEVGGQALEAMVEPAHVPRTVFSPDLVLRGEVYEREWGRLPVGTVRLETGRTLFAVKAISKRNSQIMELKAVRIRFVD